MPTKQPAKQSNKQSSAPTVNRERTPTGPGIEDFVAVAQRAVQSPSALSPLDIPILQGTIGNHAVGRLLHQNSFVPNRNGSHIYNGASKSSTEDLLTGHEMTDVGQQTELNQTPSNVGQMSLNTSSLQTGLNPVSSTETNTIQRSGGEYVPEMSVKPDDATVNMGVTHTERLDVLNTSEAPRGTSFHWGGGVSGNPGMDFVNLTYAERPHARLQVKATAPGTHEINASLQHQVPGGPAVVTEGPTIPITVPTPSVIAAQFRRSASGERDPNDATKLKIGDTVVLRLTFTNLQGPGANLGSVTGIAGSGLHSVLEPAEDTWLSSTQLDITFQARAVGAANLDIKLQLGDMTSEQAIQAHVEGHVEHDRQHFINLCNQCDTIIARAYTRANTIMEKLSAAYGDAWDAHDRTLAAQDASNRLAGEIVLAAALAFVPGGVGGQVGVWMNRVAKDTFIVDAIKDMAKAGTRVAQSAVISSNQRGDAMRPMGDNPRTWRANYVERVNGEKEAVLDILNNWKTKSNAQDPEFYTDFDPVELTQRSLIQNGQPLSDLPVPDQAENARLFELGFWREWLQTYGYTVGVQPTYGGVSYRAEENQGKKIRDRINALGENGDQWLEQYGGIAQRRAEAEAERRNRRGL